MWKGNTSWLYDYSTVLEDVAHVASGDSIMQASCNSQLVDRLTCVISGFCCKADENHAVLHYCTASSGNSLPMFWNNLLVPSSKVDHRKMGPTGCPKTLVRNYHYLLCNNPEERSSHPWQDYKQGEGCVYILIIKS